MTAVYLKVLVVVITIIIIYFGVISETPGMCSYFSRCKVIRS